MSSRTTSFDQLLLDVIDEGLIVLGEEPRKAVYQYLVTIHSLQKEDIPEKIEDFDSALKKALGAASVVIERLILKRLFQRIGSTFRESQGLEFGDYVKDAKRRFEVVKQHRTSQDEPLDYTRSKKGQLPS